ncbi:MAG: hypothetical protein EBR71_07875 [Planctomycetes bacterium]|nr:hypothetical protein [Planctomycetota bacterium]
MFVGASVTAVVAATAAATVVTYRTGPSSSATPYVIAADGSPVREVVSILTVGDSIGGFQLTGIPDGIGSFMEGDNVRIAINHEHTSAMNSVPVGQRVGRLEHLQVAGEPGHLRGAERR